MQVVGHFINGEMVADTQRVQDVYNPATGEVVRQIPNEVVIKVAHSIENIKGLLMDQMLWVMCIYF